MNSHQLDAHFPRRHQSLFISVGVSSLSQGGCGGQGQGAGKDNV